MTGFAVSLSIIAVERTVPKPEGAICNNIAVVSQDTIIHPALVAISYTCCFSYLCITRSCCFSTRLEMPKFFACVWFTIRWKEGWMDGWMAGWMDGWTGG